MFFRYLQRLTITTILLVLMVSASGAITLLASSSQSDSSSTDLSQANAVQADDSDTFFDDSYVHEIYLTFDDAYYGETGWYETLLMTLPNSTRASLASKPQHVAISAPARPI